MSPGMNINMNMVLVVGFGEGVCGRDDLSNIGYNVMFESISDNCAANIFEESPGKCIDLFGKI